jgi:hypothetical protein
MRPTGRPTTPHRPEKIEAILYLQVYLVPVVCNGVHVEMGLSDSRGFRNGCSTPTNCRPTLRPPPACPPSAPLPSRPRRAPSTLTTTPPSHGLLAATAGEGEGAAGEGEGARNGRGRDLTSPAAGAAAYRVVVSGTVDPTAAAADANGVGAIGTRVLTVAAVAYGVAVNGIVEPTAATAVACGMVVLGSGVMTAAAGAYGVVVLGTGVLAAAADPYAFAGIVVLTAGAAAGGGTGANAVAGAGAGQAAAGGAAAAAAEASAAAAAAAAAAGALLAAVARCAAASCWTLCTVTGPPALDALGTTFQRPSGPMLMLTSPLSSHSPTPDCRVTERSRMLPLPSWTSQPRPSRATPTAPRLPTAKPA